MTPDTFARTMGKPFKERWRDILLFALIFVALLNFTLHIVKWRAESAQDTRIEVLKREVQSLRAR